MGKPSKFFLKFFSFSILLACSTCFSTFDLHADDYATRQARSYISDAEYKMRQAENYRRDAEYYKRQAQSYQKDADYYTRKGDSSRAKDYLRKAENAMDNYTSKMRSAKNADIDAADYLRKAANKLTY